MKVLEQKIDTINYLQDSYIALGNFDGVHLGHQKLIDSCVIDARKNNQKAVVYTFSPHPGQVLKPNNFPGYLSSPKIKEKLLRKRGVDVLIVHKFTKEFSLLTPEEFVKNYLLTYLKPKKIFVGFDFSFGKNASGNPDLLRELGKKYGFLVHKVLPVINDNQPISSSRIRELFKNGEIEKAHDLLGYWPIIDGKVVQGDKRGRHLGFPTANIKVESDILLPKLGVYASFIEDKGIIYKAVTNIGYKPTFLGKEINVESHILNYSGEQLYNKYLIVNLVSRLRDEMKFASKDLLIKQINLDIETALEILDKTKLL
jgi:riboflavin kinase/FMN adenylyltransferase